MGYYRDQILPRMIDFLLGTEECNQQRRLCVSGLSGTVLEIGFGSGLNLPFYPDSVKKILAFDPSILGRKLARKRVDQCSTPVEFLHVGSNKIPLDSASVDYVVSTWTLCTIDELDFALQEIMRVLKPQGRFHFLEHGRSNVPSLAKWQDRLNPLQMKLGGGCNLNRKIDMLVEKAGFKIESLENYHMKGLKIGTYLYRGVARP